MVAPTRIVKVIKSYHLLKYQNILCIRVALHKQIKSYFHISHRAKEN